jgi:hypothetical protein
MGQCFTSTVGTLKLNQNQIITIPDIERNDYVFRYEKPFWVIILYLRNNSHFQNFLVMVVEKYRRAWPSVQRKGIGGKSQKTRKSLQCSKFGLVDARYRI